MNGVCRDIFRAVHEGKWLTIEYENKSSEVTKYWIGIKDINVLNKTLRVDGLHVGICKIRELTIYVDSILSSTVIDGSFCEINQGLVEDIRVNPEKYRALFDNVANLKILNYLADCHKLDATPYISNFKLIDHLDGDSFEGGFYALTDEQFRDIISKFQRKSTQKRVKPIVSQLAMNVISLHTKKGLYVLAYKSVRLDVLSHCLTALDDITLCREFTINGEKTSIRQFLDAEDYELLDVIEKNLEAVKDLLTNSCKNIYSVDDEPYLLEVNKDIMLDLEHEYSAILEMYHKDTATYPVKAFFGELLKRSASRAEFSVVLLNNKINIDQLLAMTYAMKHPVTYVQGPPGSGKTNTIINTLVTAFFNQKTVLFTSYNNHPVDGVFKTLSGLKYKGSRIPFPVVRLGNNDLINPALDYIKRLYAHAQDLTVYEATLEKNRKQYVLRTKQLMALLKTHEDRLGLLERKDAIETLKLSSSQITFQMNLQDAQLEAVNKRLSELTEVTTEDALALLDNDMDSLMQYLNFVSVSYIKRLGEPKNSELCDIVNMPADTQENADERVRCFNKYISDGENLQKFLRIFPIVITTCISAHKLGEPKPYFDIAIMDEASQCNTAVSLVPIIRGRSLMLVGDPQQLNPVILLDKKDNQILKRRYGISDEYDYIENSVYKAFLACDSVSEETLLSYHYRCHPKIIEFSNRKYYKNRLKILSQSDNDTPLLLSGVPSAPSLVKNTSEIEAEQILDHLKAHQGESIGIITPFVKQKELINDKLRQNGIGGVICGTVHAFQGDEKDTILFSLALTKSTSAKSYNWLKNNKELINVAVSRARKHLVVYASEADIARLHGVSGERDDIYELVRYVKKNGESQVSEVNVNSRALGIKPYSTKTEEAFIENLNHAMGNIMIAKNRYIIKKEVPIAQVFESNTSYTDLFYSGRFDFLVYEKINGQEYPRLAIELDGKEHFDDEIVRERDRKKKEICESHNFELIRVENSYARRYYYIKDILERFFKQR